MNTTKKRAVSTEIGNILEGLSDKNLERLLWFALGLQQSEDKYKKIETNT